MSMFECEYCKKEFKSKAGKKRHLNSCKAKHEAEVDESELDIQVPNYVDSPTDVVYIEEVNSEPITLELMDERTYSLGQIRRLEKIRLLVDKTFTNTERMKIHGVITGIIGNAY